MNTSDDSNDQLRSNLADLVEVNRGLLERLRITSTSGAHHPLLHPKACTQRAERHSDMTDTLMDRCRAFANRHTLGNIGRVGVGAAQELAVDVHAFVVAEVSRLTAERDVLYADREAIAARDGKAKT